MTRWANCATPSLSFNNDSVGVVGGRFSRNFGRASGMSFEVSVSVGRQFKSYAEAETFSLRHMAKLSGGLSGVFDYRNALGVRFGFENAVLESVRVANEIGVPLKKGYNGDLTSAQNGYVGGYMVKKMIEKQEQMMAEKNQG